MPQQGGPREGICLPPLSTTKTVSAVFHLNNKEAKRELKVNFSNEILPFCSEPKYLGATLGRSLTYRRHLESLHKKLTSRVAPLRRLAGATTLRTSTLTLVHLNAEYCAPVWCRSAHTRLIYPSINDALRIVTGCLRPTPAGNLPIFAGIQPAAWASSHWSHTISRTPCHGAWTPAPLSAHPSIFLIATQIWVSWTPREPSLKQRMKETLNMWTIFGSKLLSSISVIAICAFLKYLRYRQTQTSSSNVEDIQLRFGTPRRDPFCDPSLTLFVFRTIFREPLD